MHNLNLLTLLLQALIFAPAALAAPLSDPTFTIQDNAWKFGTGGGIIGLIVLVMDVIVFFEIFNSSRPPLHKLLWVLFVFFFPILGLIVYYLFSNRDQHQAGAGYEEIA